MTDNQRPDEIAHQLVTNVDSPVRIYLEDSTATIPLEPCRGTTPSTTTVPLEYFDAVIEQASIEDGGLTLFSMDGLHLPESEWSRTGLYRHWRHEDADLADPFFPPQRKLEIWASREDGLYNATEPYDFSHLDGIPADSPLLLEWKASATEEDPERPPLPFDRPKLSVRAVRAEGVTDVQGFDRVDVGRIARVEILEAITEQPTNPDIQPREVDFSQPSLHPEIDYEEIDPLPQSKRVLRAVFTINRHAKRLDEEADMAYQCGDGAKARVKALQKRALYRTKTVALHRLGKSEPDSIRVVRHEIDGSYELLCFYFADYSFHQPLEAVESELLEATAGSDDRSEIELEEIELEPSSATDSLELSLSEAVEVLRQNGLEPNDYLDSDVVEDFTSGIKISTTF